MTSPQNGHTAFPATCSSAANAFHLSEAGNAGSTPSEQDRPWYTDRNRVGSHEFGPVPGAPAAGMYDLSEAAAAPQDVPDVPHTGTGQWFKDFWGANKAYTVVIVAILLLIGVALISASSYSSGKTDGIAVGYHQGAVDTSAFVGKQLMDNQHQMQALQQQIQDMQTQLASPVTTTQVFACNISHTDFGPNGQAGLYVTLESGRTAFIPNSKIGYPGIYEGTTFIETLDSHGLVSATPVPGQLQSFSGCNNVNTPFGGK